MIEVENLSKRFGTTLAVRDVSFTVNRGEVVGFLGPNGAGKTTTMRILAGSLGATSGHARLGGVEVTDNPRLVKLQLGYLPELPPLYRNMTVGAYIRFAARIKGVTDIEPQVATTLERVGLIDMEQRLIQHLSKGFRQRVGLAQALVHDPDVLILDEPTSGLDPAQRVEIRDLIRELAAGDRTVILSTHVLPEVEALCERVIIINNGQVIAQDSIDALARDTRVVRLRVAQPCDAFAAALRALPGVERVSTNAEGSYIVRSQQDLRSQVARVAVQYDLLELSGREQLEDVYLRLTGEAHA